MALSSRPVFRSPNQFVADALRRKKIGFYAIERVYPPLDTGGVLECLFHDEFMRACTALITSDDGELVAYHVGW